MRFQRPKDEIVFISNARDVEGPPHQFAAALWLAKKGFRLIYVGEGNPLRGFIRTPFGKLPAVLLNRRPGVIGWLSWHCSLAASILWLRAGNRGQLYYVNGSVSCPAALIALLGVPSDQIVYHTQDFLEHGRHPIWEFFEARVSKKAGLVISNEVTRAESMRDRYALAKMPLVVPTGLLKFWPRPKSSKRQRTNLLRRFYWRTTRPRHIVFHIGPYHPLRCGLSILRAFSSLPSNYGLVFTGMDETSVRTQECTRVAAKLGISERVILLGNLPYARLLRVVAAADAGLLLYANDGIGNSNQSPGRLSEYVGGGVPVVTSAQPYLTRVVQGDRLGEVCRGSSPAAIAKAIQRVCEDGRRYPRARLAAAFRNRLCFESGAAPLEAALSAFGRQRTAS